MIYSIIGAGIAGTNAALTIRKEDPQAEIYLIGDEPYPLYSRVNISKIVSQELSPEQLILKSPEQLATLNIKTITARVDKVDIQQKIVSMSAHQDLAWDKLLVATGGRARKLNLVGNDLRGVFSFQTMQDAIELQDYIQDKKHILVVGGGFIGIEFVELLAKMNKRITLILRESWYWQGLLDEIGGNLLHEYIAKRAQVLYETELESIQGQAGVVEAVVLKSGQSIPVEAVCIGVGLELNKEFLPPELCQHGLRVNQYLVSDNPDILAAGDIAEYYDVLQDRHISGGTWANASLQGMIAGYNMVHSQAMKEYQFIPAYCPKISLPVAVVGNCRLEPSWRSLVLEQAERYVQVTLNRQDQVVGGAVIGDSAYMSQIREWIQEKKLIQSFSNAGFSLNLGQDSLA